MVTLRLGHYVGSKGIHSLESEHKINNEQKNYLILLADTPREIELDSILFYKDRN